MAKSSGLTRSIGADYEKMRITRDRLAMRRQRDRATRWEKAKRHEPKSTPVGPTPILSGFVLLSALVKGLEAGPSSRGGPR